MERIHTTTPSKEGADLEILDSPILQRADLTPSEIRLTRLRVFRYHCSPFAQSGEVFARICVIGCAIRAKPDPLNGWYVVHGFSFKIHSKSLSYEHLLVLIRQRG